MKHSTILLSGASGLLGSAILKALPVESNVVAVFHERSIVADRERINTRQIDLSSGRDVAQLFADYHFDIVINCAGVSDVDRCENDRDYALKGNVAIVENLIANTSPDCHFFHFSSDYVFGENGPHSEKDAAAPLNYYGQTKLQAEQLIQSSSLATTIIRVCSLYSTDLKAPKNILKSIVSRLQSGAEYQAATDLMSCPTSVNDLAEATVRLIAHDRLPPLVHLAGSDYMSRFGFAQLVTGSFDLDQKSIKPVTLSDLSLSAARPERGGLVSELARSLLSNDLPGAHQTLGSNRV